MNLRQEARLLLCAVHLLTRLPAPSLSRFEPDWTTRAARYYPLVGQLVGAISALVLLLAARVWSGVLPALLAVAAGALVTGGFHEDGLADAFDGLGGGSTPERRREIMKDSRLGSYGALVLGLTLAIRVGALATLPPLAGAVALLFAYGAARACAVLVMAALPYVADPAGAKLGAPLQRVTKAEAAAAVALALWPALLVGWRAALTGLALAALATLLFARQARRLIGGYTGDVLGAAEQLAEAALLLGAAV